MLEYFSSFNINIQACLVAIVINFILYFIKGKPWLGFAFFVCSYALLIYVSKSRAIALIGLATAIYFFNIKGKRLLYIGAICLLITVFLSVSSNKSGSLLGRYYILKTHCHFMLYSDSLYSTKNVNHYQISRIKSGLDGKYLYYASENQYVLNDFLQISFKYGLIGFVVMLLLLGFYYYKYYLTHRTGVINFFVILLLPFLVFLFFNCALQIVSIAWLFVLLYVQFLLSCFTFKNKLFLKASQVLLVIFVTYFIAKEVSIFQTNNTIKNDLRIGYINKALYAVQQINNTSPNKNSLFLEANILNTKSETDSAIMLLNNNHKSMCSYDFHIMLGNLYKTKHNFEKAIHHYEDARYLVPHKFEPLYLRMLLYKEAKNLTIVNQLASEIINKKPKIKNGQYFFYYKEAENCLMEIR